MCEREGQARKGLMNSYPLKSSPIAALRRRYGLSRRGAAMRLGINPRHLAALEMRTSGVPETTLDAMEALFGNLRRFMQLAVTGSNDAISVRTFCYRTGGEEEAGIAGRLFRSPSGRRWSAMSRSASGRAATPARFTTASRLSSPTRLAGEGCISVVKAAND
jgi:hypothetical protein